MQKDFKSLVDLLRAFPDEQSCINYIAELRWNGKPVCPHCKSDEKIYKFKGGKLFKCAKCRKQFSVKIGTIFEDSALPLQKWFTAMYLITAHKKGISSMQLAKDLSITQKSAWHLLHRIRFAMKTKSFNAPLENIVEVDETYIGGKEKNKHRNKRIKLASGTVGKQAVVGACERETGTVKARLVHTTSRKDIHVFVKENIAEGSTLYTDEHSGYDNLSNYGRKMVTHSSGQYVNGDVHTNTIEGFWSLLKRGIVGIYHHVSTKHLSNYVDEFCYRYNSRELRDNTRFENTFNYLEGRLTYKELIGR